MEALVIELTLFQAVEQFGRAGHALTEADLERPWAWGAYDEGLRYAFFRTYEELRELAAVSVAERSTRGPAISSAQRALAQHHAAYRDLQALLFGLPSAELDRAPAEGEWPLRTVLEHIIQAEGGFYVLVRYALERRRSGDGRPAEIPEAFWEEVVGPEELLFKAAVAGPPAEMWAYYDRLHQRVVSEFASIDAEEVQAPSRYWEGYDLPLQFRLHRFDAHLRQHTIQAEKALDALGRRPGEAMRLLRLIYAALADAEGAAIGAPDVAMQQRRATAQAIIGRAGEIAGL
jgi:hypothetical protein